MDDIIYSICDTQQRIYRYMAENSYNMKVFSDAYLNSDFCSRAMDTIYSRFQMHDELESYDFYMPEIEKQLVVYMDKMDDPDMSAWIGFTYRHLFFATSIRSAELVEIIPYETMCNYYPGLHTVDEDNALDIICHDFHLEKENYFEKWQKEYDIRKEENRRHQS